MVSCESELGKLFLDDEIAELLLVRELVAETETVVVKTETDRHLPLCRRLDEVHEKLVVIVADLSFLSPYRFPCLVEGSCLHAFNLEAVIE